MDEMIEEYFRKEYATLVKRYYNRAGSVHNSEDIVAEGFARALRYSNSFDPKRKEFGAWLNTILNNCLRNFKRDERNYGMNLEFEEDKFEGVDLGELVTMSRREIRKMIEEVGTTLQNEILTLYYINNYSPRDIERVLDCPTGTVLGTMTRFRAKVLERYEDSSR